MAAKRTMVFVNTKRAAEEIARLLEFNDLPAEAINGDVPQKKRLRLLKDFQEGTLPVLVATDVASRGLHVPMYNTAFTVYVYDGDKVDGDIISLQYNGVWLLKKYPLSKTKKALRLEIEAGADNQLVLFAENVGTYAPNTAAITFFDGKQEKNLNLSSDLSTSGALKFVFTK